MGGETRLPLRISRHPAVLRNNYCANSGQVASASNSRWRGANLKETASLRKAGPGLPRKPPCEPADAARSKTCQSMWPAQAGRMTCTPTHTMWVEVASRQARIKLGEPIVTCQTRTRGAGRSSVRRRSTHRPDGNDVPDRSRVLWWEAPLTRQYMVFA